MAYVARTHLDEIVEGTLGKDMEIATRVAAKLMVGRAFRHGVEMGGMAAVRNCEQIRLGKAPEYGGETVQPAPAEEKCPYCRHTPHPGSPCSSGECDNWRGCDNRRKGGRRSGCEQRTGYMTYARHLEYDGRDWTCGGTDRRSGKDRRK